MFYEDVNVGDKLPSISLELTVTRMVMLACATRDFAPIHHDRDYARAANARDIFLNNTTYSGFFNRLLADWGGPRSRIKKIGFRMREMNCPGDAMTGSGTVVKKYVAGDEHCVDLELSVSNQRGLTTTGNASIVLPCRTKVSV